MAPGNLEISQGIEYKLYAIFCTFAIEMYYHIVHNGSIPWVKFLESFFKLSYLLIRGLMKGLSPNFPIFSSFFYRNAPFSNVLWYESIREFLLNIF